MVREKRRVRGAFSGEKGERRLKENRWEIVVGLILGGVLGVLLGICIAHMEYGTLQFAIGLVVLVGVNVLLGTLDSRIKETFDGKKFWNGIKKGSVIALCVAAFYVVGRLVPDVAAVEIQGKKVTVGIAADILLTSAYVLYAKDVFTKLYAMILGKTPGAADKNGGGS